LILLEIDDQKFPKGIRMRFEKPVGVDVKAIKNKVFMLMGYPLFKLEKNAGQPHGMNHLYTDEGAIAQVADAAKDGYYVAYYKIDATDGQSGAPLQHKDNLQVVGVHTGTYYEGRREKKPKFSVCTLQTDKIVKEFIEPILEKFQIFSRYREKLNCTYQKFPEY